MRCNPISISLITILAPLLVFLGGCSGGDASEGDCTGSAAATSPSCQLVAPTEAPSTVKGAADFSCLERVVPSAPPTQDLIVRGKTRQRLSSGDDDDKGNVTVEVWTDQTTLSEATRVAKTVSDASGRYEVTIPASAWAAASAKGVRVAWRISAPDTVPTVEYNDPLPVAQAKPDPQDPTKLAVEGLNRITLTRSTLQTINALLGVTTDYDKSCAIVLGAVRDCKRAEVANASAGALDAKGALIAGPQLFFFQSGFPALRDNQPFTSDDGLFVLLNVPVTQKSVDVRVVGRLNGDEQRVLSRQVLPVKSDTLLIADFDPLETPLTP